MHRIDCNLAAIIIIATCNYFMVFAIKKKKTTHDTYWMEKLFKNTETVENNANRKIIKKRIQFTPVLFVLCQNRT